MLSKQSDATIYSVFWVQFTQLFLLWTAASPRRMNCKIQRNVKYKEENFFGGGEILDENLNWNSHYNSHPYPYPHTLTPTLTLGATLTLVLATPLSNNSGYRGLRSAVQWRETSTCNFYFNSNIPLSLIHIKQNKHTIHAHYAFNIPHS